MIPAVALRVFALSPGARGRSDIAVLSAVARLVFQSLPSQLTAPLVSAGRGAAWAFEEVLPRVPWSRAPSNWPTLDRMRTAFTTGSGGIVVGLPYSTVAVALWAYLRAQRDAEQARDTGTDPLHSPWLPQCIGVTSMLSSSLPYLYLNTLSTSAAALTTTVSSSETGSEAVCELDGVAASIGSALATGTSSYARAIATAAAALALPVSLPVLAPTTLPIGCEITAPNALFFRQPNVRSALPLLASALDSTAVTSVAMASMGPGGVWAMRALYSLGLPPLPFAPGGTDATVRDVASAKLAGSPAAAAAHEARVRHTLRLKRFAQLALLTNKVDAERGTNKAAPVAESRPNVLHLTGPSISTATALTVSDGAAGAAQPARRGRRATGHARGPALTLSATILVTPPAVLAAVTPFSHALLPAVATYVARYGRRWSMLAQFLASQPLAAGSPPSALTLARWARRIERAAMRMMPTSVVEVADAGDVAIPPQEHQFGVNTELPGLQLEDPMMMLDAPALMPANHSSALTVVEGDDASALGHMLITPPPYGGASSHRHGPHGAGAGAAPLLLGPPQLNGPFSWPMVVHDGESSSHADGDSQLVERSVHESRVQESPAERLDSGSDSDSDDDDDDGDNGDESGGEGESEPEEETLEMIEQRRREWLEICRSVGLDASNPLSSADKPLDELIAAAVLASKGGDAAKETLRDDDDSEDADEDEDEEDYVGDAGSSSESSSDSEAADAVSGEEENESSADSGSDGDESVIRAAAQPRFRRRTRNTKKGDDSNDGDDDTEGEGDVSLSELDDNDDDDARASDSDGAHDASSSSSDSTHDEDSSGADDESADEDEDDDDISHGSTDNSATVGSPTAPSLMTGGTDPRRRFRGASPASGSAVDSRMGSPGLASAVSGQTGTRLGIAATAHSATVGSAYSRFQGARPPLKTAGMPAAAASLFDQHPDKFKVDPRLLPDYDVDSDYSGDDGPPAGDGADSDELNNDPYTDSDDFEDDDMFNEEENDDDVDGNDDDDDDAHDAELTLDDLPVAQVSVITRKNKGRYFRNRLHAFVMPPRLRNVNSWHMGRFARLSLLRSTYARAPEEGRWGSWRMPTDPFAPAAFFCLGAGEDGPFDQERAVLVADGRAVVRDNVARVLPQPLPSMVSTMLQERARHLKPECPNIALQLVAHTTVPRDSSDAASLCWLSERRSAALTSVRTHTDHVVTRAQPLLLMSSGGQFDVTNRRHYDARARHEARVPMPDKKDSVAVCAVPRSTAWDSSLPIHAHLARALARSHAVRRAPPRIAVAPGGVPPPAAFGLLRGVLLSDLYVLGRASPPSPWALPAVELEELGDHVFSYYYASPYSTAHPGLCFSGPPPSQQQQAADELPPVVTSLTPVGVDDNGVPVPDPAASLVTVSSSWAASTAWGVETDAWSALRAELIKRQPHLPPPAGPNELSETLVEVLHVLARRRLRALQRTSEKLWAGRLPVPDDLRVRAPELLPARALVFARFPLQRLRTRVKVPPLPSPNAAANDGKVAQK